MPICGDFEIIIIIDLLKKIGSRSDSVNYSRGYLVLLLGGRVPELFKYAGCCFGF
jgi:hypothetical protein